MRTSTGNRRAHHPVCGEWVRRPLAFPFAQLLPHPESVIDLLDPEWPGLAEVCGGEDPDRSLEALLAYYRGRFPLRDFGEFFQAAPRVRRSAGCGERGSASVRLWCLTRAWEATRRDSFGEAVLAAVRGEFVAGGNALRPTRVVDFCECYPTLVHVPGFDANDLGLILNRVDVMGRRLMGGGRNATGPDGLGGSHGRSWNLPPYSPNTGTHGSGLRRVCGGHGTGF